MWCVSSCPSKIFVSFVLFEERGVVNSSSFERFGPLQHTRATERCELANEIGPAPAPFGFLLERGARVLSAHRRPIRSIGRQGIEDIDHAHDLRQERNLFA